MPVLKQILFPKVSKTLKASSNFGLELMNAFNKIHTFTKSIENAKGILQFWLKIHECPYQNKYFYQNNWFEIHEWPYQNHKLCQKLIQFFMIIDTVLFLHDKKQQTSLSKS